MPEILFLSFCMIAIMPPFLSGLFARSRGRRFWVWFLIRCILPFVSVFIIAFMPVVRSAKKNTSTI